MLFISKTNRVILPFFVSKDVKPISFLLDPKELVICLSIMVIMAQISDNLKSFLPIKDIQKMPSIKVYSKVLSTGYSSLSLSSVFAISKTLGPELESLSLLNFNERVRFLRSLHSNIIFHKVDSRLSNVSRIFVDPFELLMYRKGLAIQCRSVFTATPLFLPHSLVIGVPIKNVGLDIILESSKYLWSYWGLDEAEFEFFIFKHSWNFYMNNLKNTAFPEPTDIYKACKILIFSEFFRVLEIEEKITFDKDPFVLKGFDNDNNLTNLEKELGFFNRCLPRATNDFFVSDSLLKDDIIRIALEQRKYYNSKITKVFP